MLQADILFPQLVRNTKKCSGINNVCERRRRRRRCLPNSQVCHCFFYSIPIKWTHPLSCPSSDLPQIFSSFWNSMYLVCYGCSFTCIPAAGFPFQGGLYVHIHDSMAICRSYPWWEGACAWRLAKVLLFLWSPLKSTVSEQKSLQSNRSPEKERPVVTNPTNAS